MNILSLFSGVGGMDLGLERAGHEIVAMCEIDKHARGVLAYHWPDVPLHEDVTTLDGRQYRGSVDVVSGGSPCQDLSVAGRRKGLDGARSGLFWHQCRIADECAAPWFLWENVPGALSSNMGADFAAVLWGITGAYPRVPDGGWCNSGVIVGPNRWAVWRVLDAQWFGVAQRRRRVFVVGGSRTDMRPEILLESTGLPGDPRPQRTPGLSIAASFEEGAAQCSTVLAFDTQFGSNANVFEQHSPTLKSTQQPPSATTNTGVRRLTPIECERLMGWPDNWTLNSITGAQADSHRYRQCGNGVVANITHWIGSRL